jgi:tetratricopeptide (TPR) repeat protein
MRNLYPKNATLIFFATRVFLGILFSQIKPENAMGFHRQGRQMAGAGRRAARSGRPASYSRRLTLPALIALVSLAGTSPGLGAKTDDPAVGLDRFPLKLAAESFRLDMAGPAVAARASLSRFSQILQPLESGRAFVLPSPDFRGAQGVVEPSMRPIPPQHATTAQFDGAFTASRAGFAEALLSAATEDLATRQLDYAQFLMAHMMLPEARAVIRALPPGPDSADRDRAAGYLAIIARLGGGGPADLPAAWTNDPLWPVVVGGTTRDAVQLRRAFEALSQQSRDIATAALPHLFDVALASGDAAFAAEILAAAPAGTDLDGSGLLGLMRGRLALAQGAEDLAFDTFARVAEGHDRAAIEARIALADLALSRKDQTLLPQVSELLQEGLPRWRGDGAALRLRVQLARVAEDMGDIPTALEAMSAILQEHAGTPEAALAETRLGVMTARLAGAIADPAVPLAEAVHHVRRLDPALGARGDWLAVRKALANRLDDAGLRQAAKAEYASIAQSGGAALTVAEPAVLDALAVDHAELLLSLGDRSTARKVLDRRGLPRDPSRMAAIVALRLRAGETAILPDALLSALKVRGAQGIADPAVQLALATVAVATGETEAALAAYDRGLVLADQTQRLDASRIAAEAGDATRARIFAGGLTGERADLRTAVVESLAAPRRSGERLSVSGAAALITAADAAGQAVDALLADGGP